MNTRIAVTPQAKRLDDLSLLLGEIAGQLRDRGPDERILADVFDIYSARMYQLSLHNLDNIRPAGMR